MSDLNDELAQAEQRWIDRYGAAGVLRVYSAQSRVIRRRRTPLNLDQAARRLHLSARELRRLVKEGRVPCHDVPSQPSSPSQAERMGFDRDELDAVVGLLPQPDGTRVDEIVSMARVIQHRVGHWLHLGT